MWKYTINGETACKKNSNKFSFRCKRMFKTKRFQDWHRDALEQVMSQGVPEKPIELSRMTFTFYHGDMRNRDSDNQMTSLLDLLQDAGVISNDGWRNVPSKKIVDFFDKNKSRVDIVIEPLDKMPVID